MKRLKVKIHHSFKVKNEEEISNHASILIFFIFPSFLDFIFFPLSLLWCFHGKPREKEGDNLSIDQKFQQSGRQHCFLELAHQAEEPKSVQCQPESQESEASFWKITTSSISSSNQLNKCLPNKNRPKRKKETIWFCLECF